jgi:hypothetical protein
VYPAFGARFDLYRQAVRDVLGVQFTVPENSSDLFRGAIDKMIDYKTGPRVFGNFFLELDGIARIELLLLLGR